MARESVPPPSDLDREAKTLWRVARDQLTVDYGGVFPRALVPTLERYVRASALARLAREDRAGALTVKGSRNQGVVHPNIKTEREANLDAHKYAEALRLTPASRADLKPATPRSGKFNGMFDDNPAGKLGL